VLRRGRGAAALGGVLRRGRGAAALGGVLRRGRGAAALGGALRRETLAASVLFFGAYLLVLAALRLADPGPVAAVRETSVVIATALGAVVLHERVTPARATGALVVVAGAILIALS
jgi:drug/metabolite transporter (DMT)-like permease